MDVPGECERAVDRVREAFDDDLRAVVVHHFPGEEWEVRYVRDDVESDYDDDSLETVLEAVTDDFVFEALIQDWHEDIRRLGVLHGSVLTFEDALVARVVLTGEYGVCFSLSPDRGGDVFSLVESLDT